MTERKTVALSGFDGISSSSRAMSAAEEKKIGGCVLDMPLEKPTGCQSVKSTSRSCALALPNWQ
jgi:hypothetical protein